MVVTACAMVVTLPPQPPHESSTGTRHGGVRCLSRKAPTINEVMRRAGQYALEYEQKLSLLVAEGTYKQASKPTMAASQGGNLSTANPSGRFGPELGREQRRIDHLRGHL